MQTAVNSPLYDSITDRVASSIHDLAPDVWVERHRLLNHVSLRTVKEVKRLGIVPAQDSAGAEDRQIEERVIDDALEKVQQRVGFESSTLDGVVSYRFGPLTSRAPCSTPAPTAEPLEPVESSASAEDVVLVPAPEDETTETTCRPPASDGQGEPQQPAKSRGATNGQEVETIVLIRVEDLRPHPALEKIPEMLPHEWEVFLQDVRTRGVVDPVTVQKGNIMLDGRHRRRGARESDQESLPGRLVDWSEDEQIDYIYRAATCRRNLTDDQRAALAAEWTEQRAARSRQERARKGGQVGGRGRPKEDDGAPEATSQAAPAPKQQTARAGSLRAQAAGQFRVSERKVKGQQELRKANPALADEVRSGTKSLLQAKREARKQTEGAGASVPAKLRCFPDRENRAPQAATPAHTRADDPLVLKLTEKSPEALLDALAASFGLEEALRLLRGALHLGEQRRPRPQVRIVPTPPPDDEAEATETEPQLEMMN